MADDDKTGVAAMPPQEVLHPKCPYCSAEPMSLSVKELTFPNGVVLLMVWCAAKECRKVLTASYRGTVQPRILTPSPRA